VVEQRGALLFGRGLLKVRVDWHELAAERLQVVQDPMQRQTCVEEGREVPG